MILLESNKKFAWFSVSATADLLKSGFICRGLFPAEKGKLSCKEALDMGEDFRKCSKPSNKERANNPMMSDTPRFEFSDPHRQKQADKFFEVGHLNLLNFYQGLFKHYLSQIF